MRNFSKKNIAKMVISILLITSMLLPNINFVGTEVKAADSNEKQIWDFFKAKGYSDAGIAGIMGNIYMESSYLPYRLVSTAVTYGGYKDKGQTFTSQVDNFELTRDDFVASAKFTMPEAQWKALEASGANLNSTSYQYAYGLCMWYHYSLKRTLYDYWKKNYWTQVEAVNENGEPVMVNQAVKSIGDMEVQLNYLYNDMLTAKSNIVDKRVYNLKTELTKVSDPFYTANLFHDCYEKSARANFYKRINEAIRVYNFYSDPNTIIKLSTNAATAITENSAGINAAYQNPGKMTISKIGIKYGTDSGDMRAEQTFSVNTSNTSGTLAVRTLTGLKPSTKYFYCPVVYVGNQAYCGEIKWFTTAKATEQTEPAPAPEPVAPENFTLPTISGQNSPTEIKEGSSFTIKGIINSETPLDKVEVIVIVADGSHLLYKSAEPNTKSFSLDAMNPYEFNKLPAGTYRYIVAATNTAGTQVLTSQEFKVKKADVSYKIKSVTFDKSNYTYDGKAKDPKVIVKDDNGNTVAASNYTVTKPTGRCNVGAYSYKVTFKGKYKSNKAQTLTLKINPKGTKQSAPTGGKKCFTAKWSAQTTKMKTSRITGYEVQYSRNKSFSSNTAIKAVSGYSKKSVKITNVTAKQYYIRIRTYMTIKGKKYYSSWSEVKTVNIK